MVEQIAPVLGQGQAAGCALDQPGIEVLLQRADLARHCGLRCAHLTRDGRERPSLGDADKSTEGNEQVHRFIFPITSYFSA